MQDCIFGKTTAFFTPTPPKEIPRVSAPDWKNIKGRGFPGIDAMQRSRTEFLRTYRFQTIEKKKSRACCESHSPPEPSLLDRRRERPERSPSPTHYVLNGGDERPLMGTSWGRRGKHPLGNEVPHAALFPHHLPLSCIHDHDAGWTLFWQSSSAHERPTGASTDRPRASTASRSGEVSSPEQQVWEPAHHNIRCISFTALISCTSIFEGGFEG